MEHNIIITYVFRVCTAKVFDKSDPEGDDAAKRELKNLKSLRHERMVSQPLSKGKKSNTWNMYYELVHSCSMKRIEMRVIVNVLTYFAEPK